MMFLEKMNGYRLTAANSQYKFPSRSYHSSYSSPNSPTKINISMSLQLLKNLNMADPSTVVSFWASIANWFKPTPLFLFVNLVIGTIAIISRFSSHRKPHPQHDQLGPHYSPQLVRPPSLLERVKSVNFSLCKFPYANPEEETPEPVYDSNPVEPYPPQLQRAPSLLERVRNLSFTSVNKSQQRYPETETEVTDNSVTDLVSDPDNQPKSSKLETKKTSAKVRERVRKSASEKSMTVGEAEEKTEMVEERRPETTRPERTTSFGDDDQGVDAKADDFIDRFKKHLKLQRLDSILRRKEMLKGN